MHLSHTFSALAKRCSRCHAATFNHPLNAYDYATRT